MAKKQNAILGVATMQDGENEWRAEDDMRTLMNAEKIKKDPARLKAAKAIAKKKYEEMEEAGLCGSHKDGKSEASEASEKDDKE